MGDHGGNGPVFGTDGHHLGLLDPQVFLALQGVFHDLLVLPPVGLSTQGPHRRAFAPVEDAVLDAGLVGGPAHLASQGVQLPHQVALARAADGGVAGHVAHRVQVDGKTYRAQAHAGGGKRGFNAGVSGPDHGNIVLSSVVIGHKFVSFLSAERGKPQNNSRILSRFFSPDKSQGAHGRGVLFLLCLCTKIWYNK